MKLSTEQLLYERRKKFNIALQAIKTGINRMYLYDSLAVKEIYDKFTNLRQEIYHIEYEPDPSKYQYDMEMYIFLNYNELKQREVELRKDFALHLELGPTLLPREQHLLNACAIRWPEKETASGKIITTLAPTPWLRDLFFGMSNYQNVNVFGGGGQGKTYGVLAFYAMLFDNFIFTKPGGQCTFSTVSQTKLEGSSWGYVNKLYNSVPDYRFSLYANKAICSSEYTYRRPGKDGAKFMKEGGVFKGVLLQSGIKTARAIDKLTGCHDPIARGYLLDEAQSTDSAPLGAYTNMYLHPRYKFFNMSGNYYLDNDLLGINVQPIVGWGNVDETTHMWESQLRTPDEKLGHKSLTIHYNNDLSPAITDPEINKKYGSYLPTLKKRDDSYPTPESRKTMAFKRFWNGFRYEQEEKDSSVVKIVTAQMLKDYGCDQPPEIKPLLFMGSFDSAAASGDRNPFTVFGVGLKDGFPIVWPIKVELISHPESLAVYYEHTTNNIIRIIRANGIKSKFFIMDFTQFTALIEMLAKYGVVCHGLIYHQKCPSKREPNKLTKIMEDIIPLPKIPTLTTSGFEKSSKSFAHERVKNRITLGAYLFRYFIENGAVRNINSDILSGDNGFEKEILLRTFFVKEIGGNPIICIDDKRKFNQKHKFSPDILDTIFQFFYMIYVIFKIDPRKKGLGEIQLEEKKKEVDKIPSLWDTVRSDRFK